MQGQGTRFVAKYLFLTAGGFAREESGRETSELWKIFNGHTFSVRRVVSKSDARVRRIVEDTLRIGLGDLVEFTARAHDETKA